ncbi:MAG: hypothetical protein L3K16_03595 [Thermoplasmata archaeon]|nr:hypothetical protein [Thermoplasmata archaeon]
MLAAALVRLGRAVAHPVWNDPGVDWDAYRCVVIRSTWDYWHVRPAYLRWVNRVARATALWNRPETVRWNTDKRYLRELERAGIAIVPTVWSPRGRPLDLASTMDEHGWTTAVVKPAVSAAGDRTFRVERPDAARAQRQLDRLARTGVGIVQPYVPSAAEGGERSLIFLDGRFSHCVQRIPLFDRAAPAPPETLVRATGGMRRLAEAALAECPGDLLYARVDLIDGGVGGWQVLEMELTEPSLFFVPYPRGAATLAKAIVRRIGR